MNSVTVILERPINHYHKRTHFPICSHCLFRKITITSALGTLQPPRHFGTKQERNFGLKSGGYQFRRRTRCPWQERRMGRYSPPHQTLGSRRVLWALPARSGVQPRLKTIILWFNLLKSLLLKQVTSKFFTFSYLNVCMYGSLQSKKWDVPVPLVPP